MCKFLLLAFLLTMTTSIFAQTATPIDAGVSQTLAKWRAANYSDVRYKLNLTLEKMSPTLKGTIEISVNVRQTGAETKKAGEFQKLDSLPTIVLDWRKIKGKENLSTVSNVSINGGRVVLNPDSNKFGVIVAFREEQNFFEINEHLVFQDGIKIGENIIKLDFTSPIATSGAAITRYVDKEDAAEYVYSLFVPSDASTAFPVFDQPDLKARFQLNLTIPSDWLAVSNTDGKLNIDEKKIKIQEDRKAGKVTILYPFEKVEIGFAETKPISTYVFAFAAGDFAEFPQKDLSEINSKSNIFDDAIKEGKLSVSTFTIDKKNNSNTKAEIPLQTKIYVRKSQAEKFKQHAAEVFRLNREGVKFLESWFDYKFPFPKYDLVLIPEFPFGGMEHAGATFLREDRVIFPTEPTKNDYITRANLIFHEAAHQWFGDTVTMRWFDDLWLKEGFAEFMAYKTLEKVMPEYNAWKIFYERNKQLAYLTDSTRGTTPIYQEIPNLSAAKSAYGNIVYRKAPSFLRQAEFYLGEKEFQTAVRAFLKKHEFANAEWTDLVKEFELASNQNLKDWGNVWVKQRGLPRLTLFTDKFDRHCLIQTNSPVNEGKSWKMKIEILYRFSDNSNKTETFSEFQPIGESATLNCIDTKSKFSKKVSFVFPNYQDYGYGIFLLDEKSRAYVLANIQNEKDDFLRAMMWGSLWDSVRETELAPADYVRLVIKNINVESDESTIQTLLGRVSTAMNYYLPDAQSKELAPRLETLLIDKMRNAPTLGQRITFYRAFLNVASTDKARTVLKEFLNTANKGGNPSVSAGAKTLETSKSNEKNAPLLTRGLLPLKTKDKFDIVTKLLILNDKDAPQLLVELEKTETSDEAKRYAYAARAGIATTENKQKFFNDFTGNKEISESYIETAFAPFNSTKHADLTLPFLENALKELPNLKRNRKIFFVNGWLGAFIGGQKSEQALQIVNKFLADNPNLDKDLRLKILENADGLERAVKIRKKFAD